MSITDPEIMTSRQIMESPTIQHIKKRTNRRISDMWAVILLRDATGIAHGIYMLDKYETQEEAWDHVGRLLAVNPKCKFDVLEVN